MFHISNSFVASWDQLLIAKNRSQLDITKTELLIFYNLLELTVAVNDSHALFSINRLSSLFTKSLYQSFIFPINLSKKIKSLLSILCRGSLSQNLYIESLALTSATFVSAMANLIPAITFIMAIAIGYIFPFLTHPILG